MRIESLVLCGRCNFFSVLEGRLSPKFIDTVFGGLVWRSGLLATQYGVTQKMQQVTTLSYFALWKFRELERCLGFS